MSLTRWTDLFEGLARKEARQVLSAHKRAKREAKEEARLLREQGLRHEAIQRLTLCLTGLGQGAKARRRIARLDGWFCWYCARPLDRNGTARWGGATLEHVIPIRDGGKTSWQNCRLACQECQAARALLREALGPDRYREVAEVHLRDMSVFR